MKIAIFWEKRFNDNKFLDLSIDQNLSPFVELAKANGMENTISSDLLATRSDRDEFIIFCFLTFSLFNIWEYIKMLWKYPKNKKYLFLFEPPVVAPLLYLRIFHVFFERIYTWNDTLVDGKRYYKFIWPQSRNSFLSWVPFSQKKNIVLMNANKFSLGKHELYSTRVEIIRYFEKNNIEFDLYGPAWWRPNLKQKICWYTHFSSWKWRAEDKIATIANYKFNICFENMSDTPWYITEKIWDSFKAKTVPVYWWASNIEEYVPKNCFIDYRDFWDFARLEKFLLALTEDEYNTYIQNIEWFLETENAKKWFDKDWAVNFIKNLL